MRIIFLGLLFLSLNSFGQSLSPYFTRTRTLQLEGYSSTGVNIPYSYSGGSVNSWTINDTLAHSWVNERVQAALTGFTSIDSARVYDSLADHRTDIDLKLNIADADYWPLAGNFSTTGNQTITTGGNVIFDLSGSEFFRVGRNLTTAIAVDAGLTRVQSPDASNAFLITNSGSTYNSSGGSPISYGTGIDFFGGKQIPHTDWTESHLGQVELSTLAQLPTVTENGYSVTWDNTASEYTLTNVAGGGVNESYVATSIDSVRNEVEADSVLYWKRSGISNLGSGDIQIRKTTVGNVSILNEDDLGFLIENTSGRTKLGDDNNYLQFYNGTINGFLLDSDSIQFNALSNQSMLITDKRSAGNRHGLRYAGDYSPQIRATPNALTTMKTVWDYVDSLGLGSPDASDVSYTPATTGDWPNADPITVQGGLDSLAERMTKAFKLIPDTVHIGSWNMHVSSAGTSAVFVTITGIPYNKIFDIRATIINDNENTHYNFTRATPGGTETSGSISYWTGATDTSVELITYTSGMFDNTSYDRTDMNRGYLLFYYIE